MHGKLVPHYQMYFAGDGMSGGALALKGPSLPVARIKQAIERVQQAHLVSGEESFFAWARCAGCRLLQAVARRSGRSEGG